MNIFCFDAETDGLYGDIFAIGAVVCDEHGVKIEQFQGIAEVGAVSDDWVNENIVPKLGGMSEYETRKSMRDAFWHFWMRHRESCVCVADFGAPVEAYLFRLCVADDPGERTWKAPYPMHELGTALFLAGIDPDINREEYAVVAGRDTMKHNPVFDANVAAMCWVKCRKSI